MYKEIILELAEYHSLSLAGGTRSPCINFTIHILTYSVVSKPVGQQNPPRYVRSPSCSHVCIPGTSMKGSLQVLQFFYRNGASWNPETPTELYPRILFFTLVSYMNTSFNV
jgi:hypothetical protein